MTTSNGDTMAEVAVVTFMLGDQYYALRIDDVIEVAAMVELIHLANARPEILGAVNRHGTVLPVLDARLMLGHDALPIDDMTMFIVVGLDDPVMGLVVDRVFQVEYISGQKLNLSGVDRFVRGLLTQGSRVIQLLDLEQILEAFLSESAVQEGQQE
jgi:chemotaxis signal transduction protein